MVSSSTNTWSLLPQPRRVMPGEGEFRPAGRVALGAPENMEAPERIALGELETAIDMHIGPCTRVAAGGNVTLRIDPAGRWPADGPECHRLTVRPDGVELIGRSALGLLQGLRTLIQAARSFGRSWPCMTVEDYPAFAVRGFYHDVSRGKVPTVATLKRLIDRLAQLKINQFQIYVEHVFDFAFDPDISRGSSPITPDEVRELDAYCRDRRIDFVPSLASFGHMARILSLPAYRELAEIEADTSWESMPWRQRVMGLTIDPYNPKSRALLERMYAEYVPLFPSPLMNACADETFDLGKGRNKAKAAQVGIGRLYVDHIKWLHELCRRHGKRMMIWGDVVKQHPELVGEIPRDTILLNWLYSADSDFDSTALFRDAGLDTYACPGCSGWNRFVNGINNADLNIRRFAAAGVKYGSQGLLNTDWGDEGYVNFLACSWHPIVLGAAMAWNVEAPGPEAFDRAFGQFLFGRPDAEAAEALRKVARTGDALDQWRIFYASFDNAGEHARMGAERIAAAERDGEAAAALFDTYRENGWGDAQDCAELALACRLVALTGRKARLAGASQAGIAGNLGPQFKELAAQVRRRAEQFESLWLARNRRSDLDRVLKAFCRVADEADAAAVARV